MSSPRRSFALVPVVLGSFFLGACAVGSMGTGGAGRGDDGPAVVTVGSSSEEPATDASPVVAPPEETTAAGRCAPATARCAGLCTDLSTDAAHCGACGHSCLGGVCEAGRCAPVAALTLGTALQSFDVAFGTVVAASTDAMFVLPRQTSAPVRLPLFSPGGFRVVDLGIAFSDEASIRIADFTGKDPEVLFARDQAPRALSYSLGSLQWIEKSSDVSLGDADELVLGDLYWGDTHVLAAPGEPIALAASAGYYVYYATKSGKLQRTIRDRWADPRIDVTDLQDLGEPPAALAATYGLVAWAPKDAARIEGLHTRTRQPFVTPTLPSAPTQLLADDEALYFVVHPTAATVAVERITPAAPAPTVLWSGEDEVLALRVDDDAVYWSTATGTVWRIAK